VELLHGAFLYGLAREYGRGARGRWRRELAPVGAGEGRRHLRTPRGVQLFLPLEARDVRAAKAAALAAQGGGPGGDVGAVCSVLRVSVVVCVFTPMESQLRVNIHSSTASDEVEEERVGPLLEDRILIDPADGFLPSFIYFITRPPLTRRPSSTVAGKAITL